MPSLPQTTEKVTETVAYRIRETSTTSPVTSHTGDWDNVKEARQFRDEIAAMPTTPFDTIEVVRVTVRTVRTVTEEVV